MIVVRDVFRAKYGSGGDLENVFKEMLPSLERAITEVGGGDVRMMEDLSGEFFTIVVEYTLPSLSAWEGAREKMFALPEFGGLFERMVPLVETGKREFWNVVAG